MALPSCCSIDTAAPIGGLFDQWEALPERLRFGPDPSPQQGHHKPGKPPKSRWTLQLIREQIEGLHDYSVAGVWKLLRSCGIRLRWGRPQMYSPDPAYREKEARLLAALATAHQHPRQIVVLFVDEMSYCSWPEAGADWCEQAPAPIPLAVRKPARFRRRRLIGALNATTGRVYYRDEPHISGEVAAAFLKLLARAYRWACTIYVVWDNWPVQKT